MSRVDAVECDYVASLIQLQKMYKNKADFISYILMEIKKGKQYGFFNQWSCDLQCFETHGQALDKKRGHQESRIFHYSDDELSICSLDELALQLTYGEFLQPNEAFQSIKRAINNIKKRHL